MTPRMDRSMYSPDRQLSCVKWNGDRKYEHDSRDLSMSDLSQSVKMLRVGSPAVAGRHGV